MPRTFTRARIVLRAAAAAAVALAGAACQASGGSEAGTDEDEARAPDTDLERGPFEDVVSAIDDPEYDGFPEPLIDVDRLISGGPPADGIPALVDPLFEDPGEVDWLEDPEPVLAVSLEGEDRAYPVQILIWHEIVNDEVGDIPVAVTYCPLCDSAIAFDRRVEDGVLDFGVSGLLYNSDLVMFDRQTNSLWPQIEGMAAVGELTGAELERVTVTVVPWSQWRDDHPDGSVLSQETGHDRNYGTNPYVGYDDPDSDPYLLDEDADPRMPPMARVVGLGEGDGALAIPADDLAEEGVVDVEVGGEPVTVWAEPGAASALDSGTISEGRELTSTGAFSPVLDGRSLSFEATGDGFTDAETGSTWNILGAAVDGELEGERLDPVEHLSTFWFAWVAFTPETEIAE